MIPVAYSYLKLLNLVKLEDVQDKFVGAALVAAFVGAARVAARDRERLKGWAPAHARRPPTIPPVTVQADEIAQHCDRQIASGCRADQPKR